MLATNHAQSFKNRQVKKNKKIEKVKIAKI